PPPVQRAAWLGPAPAWSQGRRPRTRCAKAPRRGPDPPRTSLNCRSADPLSRVRLPAQRRLPRASPDGIPAPNSSFTPARIPLIRNLSASERLGNLTLLT